MSAAVYPHPLVDIGANLAHPGYAHDLDSVLKRAKDAGLKHIMLTGTDVKVSREVAKLAEREPGFLHFTAGVHPHEAKDWNDQTESELRELLSNPQCVAVGECGLDYNRNFSPPEQQRQAFRQQVKLAVDLQKPLFIHEREASKDLLEILAEEGGTRLPALVVHCFTGLAAEAEEYVRRGFFVGLTGFLWKDRSEDGVVAALKSGKLPLDRLVLETDAPYMYANVRDKKLKGVFEMSPEAESSWKFTSFKRNEPCALPAICELIAKHIGVSAKEVAETTTRNARTIYRLE